MAEEKDFLTNDEWIELTEDLVELVEKHSKKEEDEWSKTPSETWSKFQDMRESVQDFIQEIRGENNGNNLQRTTAREPRSGDGRIVALIYGTAPIYKINRGTLLGVI